MRDDKKLVVGDPPKEYDYKKFSDILNRIEVFANSIMAAGPARLSAIDTTGMPTSGTGLRDNAVYNHNGVLVVQPATGVDADTLGGHDPSYYGAALGYTPVNKAGDTMTGGLAFGSTAVASPTDVTRHIALWGTQFGFSISNNSQNYVVNSTSAHHFYVGASNSFTVDSGVVVGSPTGGDPGAGKINAVDYQINGTSISSLYALLSGATFTGNVTVAPASSDARVITRKAASGSNSGILGYTGNYARWFLALGDASVESGSDTGSAAVLYRYSDTGAFLGTAFSFNRSTGLGTVAGDPTTALGIATKQYVDNNFAPFSGGFTFSGAVTFGGNSTSFAGPGSGNVSIELGGHGYSNSAFIDFHSGATDVDYDSRIIASGGDGTVGHGTLTLAASHVLWGTAPTSASDLVNKTYADSLPLAQSYESAQQAITSGGALSLSHGLGAQPKLYQAFLICTTADGGYAVGDEVATNPSISAVNTNSRGISLVPTSTTIGVRFGSEVQSISLIRKDTGAQFQITNSSWKLVVRAWL